MFIVLNFKTYLKKDKDYLKIIDKLKKIKIKDGFKICLAINPYFYLNLVSKLNKDLNKKFILGLQNLAPLSEKPQTGEIIYDFKGLNLARFVLIGHSERYRLGENEEIIKQKIKTLQDKKIKLLIFFSENSYQAKDKFYQVKKETQKKLDDFISVIKKENYNKIYFVYEPWWAISTEGGKIPSVEFLSEFLNWYKNYLNSKYGVFIPILYGGSCDSKIIQIYNKVNFNGYVLGKASISIKEVKNILSYLS